jgi:AGCS family alanine or glycine:cation symporter
MVLLWPTSMDVPFWHEARAMEITYKILFLYLYHNWRFCQIWSSVWGFSDAMILAMVFPNMIGLLFLFPVVKDQLAKFEKAIKGHK